MRLQSALISSLDGRHLDGDFTGTLPSGDGHPGGNFSFQVKNDKSKTPTVRMSTTEGVMNIQMDETNTPLTVDNFLNYANAGDYDSAIFTRAVTGFIIQGGSMNVTSSNTMGAVPIDAGRLLTSTARQNAGTTSRNDRAGQVGKRSQFRDESVLLQPHRQQQHAG